MNPWLFLMPVISAIIGWILNNFIGKYFLNTYLPAQQPAIAKEVAGAAKTFFEENLKLEEKVSDPALIEKALPTIEKHIDEFLNVKLKEEIPMLAMFIGNKTTDKVKEVFMNQLKELFPKVMTELAHNLKTDLNIERSIEQKLNLLNIKPMLQNKVRPQINKLNLAGLLTGFIIGTLNLIYIFFIMRS